MWIAEQVLFGLAKAMYHSEVAHSSDMKNSLANIDAYDSHRAKEMERIIEAVRMYKLDIHGKKVIDFGCNDGALTPGYLKHGASIAIGVDADSEAINRARKLQCDERLQFVHSGIETIPLEDASVDAVISYDVFEHVSKPAPILSELHRVLVPGGKMLIGTWSWYHPFAPHLWSVMPVPWAHVLFSEATMLRVCRRVYLSKWYVPNMHDFEASGERRMNKYMETELSKDYLNKLLIKDFEQAFTSAGFTCQTNLIPFGSRYMRWTRPLLHVPLLREFMSGYAWFMLEKPETPSSSPGGSTNLFRGLGFYGGT